MLKDLSDTNDKINVVGQLVAEALQKREVRWSAWCQSYEVYSSFLVFELKWRGPFCSEDEERATVNECYIDEDFNFDSESWLNEQYLPKKQKEKEEREAKVKAKQEELNEYNIQMAIKRLEEAGYTVTKKVDTN